MKTIVCLAPENNGLGFLFRENHGADYGVDGQIEVIDDAAGAGYATSRAVAVQVKTGDSYVARETEDEYRVYIDKVTVRYWREHAIPVVLALVNPTTRAVFWARVDDAPFHETRQNYRIPVPKHQVLDSTARDAIRAIAFARNPPVSSLIVPSALSGARAALAQRERAANTAESVRQLAHDYMALSERYRSAQDLRGCAELIASAARCQNRAGATELAMRTVVRAMRIFIDDLHDGAWANRVSRHALVVDRIDGSEPLRALREPELPPDVRLPYRLALAEAELLEGGCEIAEVVADEIERAGADAVALSHPDYLVSLLRARACVARDHQDEAALHFERAAERAPSGDLVEMLRLRASLHRGLAGEHSAAITSLNSLTATGSLDAMRQRAIAWVAVLTGDYELAATAARSCIDMAAAENDHFRARRAYELAAWAERRSLRYTVGSAAPSLMAQRITDVHVSRERDHVTPSTLLERAERALRSARLRDAYDAAYGAMALAYDAVDPPLVDRSRLVIAECLRRAAVGDTDVDSLHGALVATAATRAHLSRDEAHDVLPRFYQELTEHYSEALMARSVAALTDAWDSRASRAGGLRVLAEIATLIPDDLIDERLQRAIESGLADGWTQELHETSATAACSLIDALGARLPPRIAIALLPRLLEELERCPLVHRSRLVNAVLTAIYAAPELHGGGLQIIGLCEQLRQRQDYQHDQGTIQSILVATAARGSEAAKARIREILGDVAGRRDWETVRLLVARNVSTPQEYADRFFESAQAAVERMLAQAGSHSYRFGPSHPPDLFGVLAPHASERTRDVFIDKAIELIQLTEYPDIGRAPWVQSMGEAACASPARRQTARVLSRIAREGLATVPGRARPRGSALLRVSLSDESDSVRQRVAAAAVLCQIAGSGGAEETANALEALEALAVDSSPRLRSIAAKGAGKVIVELSRLDLLSQRSSEDPMRQLRDRLMSVVQLLARDRSVRVRELALEALVDVLQTSGSDA